MVCRRVWSNGVDILVRGRVAVLGRGLKQAERKERR